MILNYRKLRSDPDPPKRCIRNVQNYMSNRGYSQAPGEQNSGPIVDKECDFINKTGDLVALVPKVKQPLRRMLDPCGWFMLRRWFKDNTVSGSSPTNLDHPQLTQVAKQKGSHKYHDLYRATLYPSDKKVDTFLTALTLAAGLALLIGPLQFLDSLSTVKEKLNAISGLITGFLVVMASVMVTQPWETLAATAAYVLNCSLNQSLSSCTKPLLTSIRYAAVLMVFVQINQNLPGQSVPVVNNGTLEALWQTEGLF